jgi:ribosome-associated protein
MQHKPEQIDEISKTKLKAEADAAQDIGKKLIDLPKDRLIKLALPESLFEAVMEAKRITANGAIRRQRQYIGKLMRDLDTAAIEEQLAKWEGKNAEENARFHMMERWRTRLLDDVSAVSEFMMAFPKVDSQHLRTLIRNSQIEIKANKPPKNQRELFKMIRTWMEEV